MDSNESPPKTNSRVATKRKAQRLTGYDAILADDNERHLRKSVGTNPGEVSLGEPIHKGLKPNLIGPILATRFLKRRAEGHSFSDEAKRPRN